MSKWTEATMGDLKKGDVFRFDADDKPSRVTARWTDGGEVRLFSHSVATDLPDGLSAARPGKRIQILK